MLEECQFVRYSARGWLMADYADRFTLDKTGIVVEPTYHPQCMYYRQMISILTTAAEGSY